MRKIFGKSIVLVFIGLCILFSSCIVTAEPITVVSVEPLQPVRRSTVSFTANITGEDVIDDVFIKIQECTPTICHGPVNVSMEPDNKNYSVSFTLNYDDTTYFKYWLEIKSDDSWYTTDKVNVTLKIDANNGGNTNGNTNNADKDDDKGLPGFEIIVFMAAIFVVLIFFRRKRL